jgi:hypothetical protein
MSSEMIERVAQAMHDKAMLGYSWSFEDKDEKVQWRSFARAAIEAMRVPTPAMSETVQRKHIEQQCGVSVVWMDMIDEALR